MGGYVAVEGRVEICVNSDGLQLSCVTSLGIVWMLELYVFNLATYKVVSTPHDVHFKAIRIANYNRIYFIIGAVAYSNAAFGAGIGTSLLSSVNCNGSESSLLECSYNNNGCSHTNDAGVRCQGNYCAIHLKIIK